MEFDPNIPDMDYSPEEVEEIDDDYPNEDEVMEKYYNNKYE